MRKSTICIGALALALTACSSHQSMPGMTASAASHNMGPGVVQTGKTPVQWTQFKWGSTSTPSAFDSIVTGSDKNIWYTDYNGQNLIQMKVAGTTKVFPLTYNAGTHFYPGNMTVGADGKFYIGSNNASGIIGVAKTTGAFSTVAIPSGDYSYNGRLTLGPDGNVWFTELKHIAKISTTGKVTEFAYPDGNQSNYYGAIATGPDGDIWATEYNQPYIDDVDPDTGAITVYSMPCALIGLVSAPDGNLYGPCSSSLVRITTSGTWSVISNPFSTDGYPGSFINGLDGNPWFTANTNSNDVIQYNTSNGTLHAYYPPSTFGYNYALAAGPDGNYWAIGNNSMINVYIVEVLSVTPFPIKLTSIGQTQVITIAEPNTSSWTVTSSSPGVATVTPVTGHPNEYTVKAVGVGTTNVTVKDAIGNSFVDKVTVT